MGKVNFILDEAVQEELKMVVPPRQRSKMVNEAIKKELLRIKRRSASEKLLLIREKTAKYNSSEINAQLEKDRKR